MMPGTIKNSRNDKEAVIVSLQSSLQLRVGLSGTEIEYYTTQEPGWLRELKQNIPGLERIFWELTLGKKAKMPVLAGIESPPDPIAVPA